MRKFGPHDSTVRSHVTAAFGRNLYRTLPEDSFDDQPIVLSDPGGLVVADARVDNRGELIEALGIDRRQAPRMSDSAFLAMAWQKWRVGLCDHVIGDYAMAAFDASERALVLLRSPLSMKPLFYHFGPKFVAFASMPAGLLALEQVPREINFEQAAAVVAEVTNVGWATMFAGIDRVRPGEAIRIQDGRLTRFPIWELRRSTPTGRTPDQWAEEFQAEFDRAVAACLRRHEGHASSQLSSGRDSSAVTASAAITLGDRGEDLFAFTGAHRLGFKTPDIPNRIADESALAAVTAAMYPNIRHVVSRRDAPTIFPYFDLLSEVHYGPLLGPSALTWVPKVNDDAVARRVSVMLLGSRGNFTVSAGGGHHMRDLLRENGFADWLRTAVARGGRSWTNWRHILKVTLGPSVPRNAFATALKAAGRGYRSETRVPLLRQPYRHHGEQLLRDRWADLRPQKSFFDYRRDKLLGAEYSEKITLAAWGIDVRDPTIDRRFVELCFALPVEQLVSRDSQRPIYEAAFASRLPREVVLGRRRGYQSPDWYDAFPPGEIRAAYERYGRNPIVRELIDLEHARELLENWPDGGWYSGPTVATYRNRLLETLAVASFIDVHFPA